MKLHLFKIEQFFDEQLVLNAELRYPFVDIKMEKEASNKVKFDIGVNEARLELDKSHEYITAMSCSCNEYSQNASCIHLILAAWEFRKQGFPQKKTAQVSSSIPQISSIINEIEEKNLRQFLLGYASRNREFNLVIKLLFSHEVNHSLPYKEIKKQLYNLFEYFRTSLDTKKHQKTYVFYLRTFLGVAEDLIARKDYRSGSFYALSIWELWMDKRFQMIKISDAKANYEQLLSVLARIERSPISPELYKYIFKTISQKIHEEEAQPILEYDVPELLIDWDELSEDEYSDLVLRKIAHTRSTEYWVSRFIRNLDSYSNEQLEFAKQYIRRLSIDKILRKLQGEPTELDDRSFFYIIHLKGHINKNDIRRLRQMLIEDFQFLADLHLLSRYGEHAKIEPILYQTDFSEKGKQALKIYLDTQEVPDWVRLLVRHHLFNETDVFEQIENIEDPKEWIHLLAHLQTAEQKVVIEKIKSYCLTFAANHIGIRSRQHLQTIGQMLSQNGFGAEWSKIREEIINKFDHRNSIQSLEHPLL